MNLPDFASFYHSLHGRDPYPWQVALAQRVLQQGWRGLALDLPTGSGKTSALEIALYVLACRPEIAPRRTVLVVDRRVVVDQAAEHALKIQKSLREAKSGPARQVADCLRSLFDGKADKDCVAVAVMRGGIPRENDWARRPDIPLLGLSTVDQLGSRLLFRGYGVSLKSAPIHAGLLGNDTLILLDEVHLSRPFAETLARVEQAYRGPESALPRRFAVVPMSATRGQDEDARESFALGDEDRQHPVLSQVLNASKQARLERVAVTGPEPNRLQKIADVARQRASELVAQGAKTVGIIVNRVETARLVRTLLQKGNQEGILLTGRMRPLERDATVDQDLLRVAGNQRKRDSADPPVVVVATQCIEAGADLDFDALITEAAPLDALRQRFGRLDRRGNLEQTQAIVLMRSDLEAPTAEEPIYGQAVGATWSWLQEIAADQIVDFGYQAMAAYLETLQGELTTLCSPARQAPVLMPGHLDGWAQTSCRPDPDADVSLWLHGPNLDPGDVQVVWRPLQSFEGQEFAYLDFLRPTGLEAISLPVGVARRWLSGSAETPGLSDVLAGVPVESEEAEEAPRVYRWTGDEDTSAWIVPKEIRPGDTLVLDTERGGLRFGSFDPSSLARVPGLAELGQLKSRGLAALTLIPESLIDLGLTLELVAALPVRDALAQDKEYREDVAHWIGSWPPEPPSATVCSARDWKILRDNLSNGPKTMFLQGKDGAEIAVIWRKLENANSNSMSEIVTELADSAFSGAQVELDYHCQDVGRRASLYASRLGFDESLVSDLKLAGNLHDLGKADPRFQKWLVGGDEVRALTLKAPLAKSEFPSGDAVSRESARRRAGYPKGYRHELLSLAMLDAHVDELAMDGQLVRHLVASHHGWARPFAPPQDFDEDLEVRLQAEGREFVGRTRHRLARLDSGVSDRFWSLTERFGWWELAWLESLLRLADHNSSDASERGRKKGTQA